MKKFSLVALVALMGISEGLIAVPGAPEGQRNLVSSKTSHYVNVIIPERAENIYATPQRSIGVQQQTTPNLNLQIAPDRKYSGLMGGAKYVVRELDKKLLSTEVPSLKKDSTVAATTANIKLLEKYVDKKKTTFSRSTTLSAEDVKNLDIQIKTVQEQIAALKTSNSMEGKAAKISNLSSLEARLNRVIANLQIRSEKTADATTALNKKFDANEVKKAEKAAKKQEKAVKKAEAKKAKADITISRFGIEKTSGTVLGKTLPEVTTYDVKKSSSAAVNQMVKDYKEIALQETIKSADIDKVLNYIPKVKDNVESAIRTLEANRKIAENAILALRENKITTDQNAAQAWNNAKGLQTIGAGWNRVTAYVNHKVVNSKLVVAKRTFYNARRRELKARIIKENYDRQLTNLTDSKNTGNSSHKSWTDANPRIELRVARELVDYQSISSVKQDLVAVNAVNDPILKAQLFENMAKKIVDMPIEQQGRYLLNSSFTKDFEMAQNIYESVLKSQDKHAQYVAAKVLDGVLKRKDASGLGTIETKLDGQKEWIKEKLEKNKPEVEVDKQDLRPAKATKTSEKRVEDDLNSEDLDEEEDWGADDGNTNSVTSPKSPEFVYSTPPVAAPRRTKLVEQLQQTAQEQYDVKYKEFLDLINKKETQKAEAMIETLNDLAGKLPAQLTPTVSAFSNASNA